MDSIRWGDCYGSLQLLKHRFEGKLCWVHSGPDEVQLGRSRVNKFLREIECVAKHKGTSLSLGTILCIC